MSSARNLINNHEQRNSRVQEKQHLVLRFLRDHLWSNQDILQQVIMVSSRQAAHKALTHIEKKGLIKRHKYEALGGTITIWGITIQGQAMAFDVETEVLETAYFEPNRISEQTIRHQLDIQQLRLKAEAEGWNGWMDGDRLGSSDRDQKRPDALAKNKIGMLIAVECERTFKSIKRYEVILVNYLKLIKAGEIKEVVWASPNADISARLKSIITGIKFVRINGQKFQIDPLKHHVHLHFCSYQDWPLHL
ncbi:MAG: replication-relaxation family protein [Bacteroidia bacterium]|nr:replication-relaxation family protein [Methylotenera sp.]